jgi:hypothetical protein
MLSPKATKLIALRCEDTSVTVSEHTAVRLSASRAVQLTVVAPTGNTAPDAGEQVVVTGGVPPVVTGLA